MKKRIAQFLSSSMAHYIACMLAVLVLLFQLYSLSDADLKVPVIAEGDAAGVLRCFESVRDFGFLGAYINPNLSAPDGADYRDYPSADLLTTFLIWLLTRFSGSAAMAFNLFILLSFFIVAFFSLYVFRQIGIHKILSICFAVLYTFIPFHQIRLGHTWLLLYPSVPIAFLLLFRLFQEPEKLFYHNGHWNSRRPMLQCMAWCFFIIMTGVLYYPFFAGYAVLIAAIYLCFAADKGKIKENLMNSGGIILSLIIGLMINYAPYFIFWLKNGISVSALARNQGDAEIYALKIIQLLLPRSGHRLPFFAKLNAFYSSHYPLVNENMTASVGLIGALGLVILFLCLFMRKRKMSIMAPAEYEMLSYLSVVNLFLILLGTMGGFSSVVSLLFAPIRGYNRISVFIAFICLMTVGYVLTWLLSKIQSSSRRTLSAGCVGLSLLIAGVWDQTVPQNFTNPVFAQTFYSDQEEIADITRFFEPGTMIYQMPSVSFPYLPYETYFPYIHDDIGLKWSSGAPVGRETDSTLQTLDQMPLPDRMAEVIHLGFSAVLVQKNFTSDAENLLIGLNSIIGPALYESNNYALFSLLNADSDSLSSFPMDNPLDAANMKSTITAALSEDGNVHIDVRNLSQEIYGSGGDYPVNLGIHLLSADKSVLNWDFSRISLGTLKPEAEKSFVFVVPKTMEPGRYYLQFQLVQEMVAWFPTEITETNVSQVAIEVK